MFDIMNEYNAPVIKKAIDILVLIGKENRPLGVSEIAKILAYSKSTTHGVLKALSEVGFLYKDAETRKYSIGKKLLRLSKIIYKNQDILFIIRPYLESLVESIDETVFFGVKENDVLKILIVVEAKKSLKLSAPVGTRVPITAGAAGKVFFSVLKNDEIISIVKEKGLPKYTENTITNIDDFIIEIDKTRESGYGIDLEEYLKGVRAVASLICQDNHPLGAIWVVGFSNSIIDEKLQFIIKQLKNTALRINKRISFSSFMDENKKVRE